jgi:putative redox protein
MKATIKLEKGMRFVGENEGGLKTYFDSHSQFGGEESAATPMEVMLQSLGSCTVMDVLSMLRKRRKTIDGFNVYLEAERADEHPKVYTSVKLIYELISPDAKIEELDHAVNLSQEKYCGASEMFRKSGCEVTWETVVKEK